LTTPNSGSCATTVTPPAEATAPSGEETANWPRHERIEMNVKSQAMEAWTVIQAGEDRAMIEQ